MGRSDCAYLIPASKSCPRPLRGRSNQNTFNPVGLRFPHSCVEDQQDHFWVGRAVPISFRRRKVTKTDSGPVGPYLTHSGVKGHLNHFWAGRTVTISFRRRRVPQDPFRPLGSRLPHSGVEPTKTTSGPVELCQSHSGVEKLSRPLQGWSGRIYLIPATKGHPNHFWAGRTVPISLRCQRPPRPLLSRSGCVYLIPASKSCQERFWAGQRSGYVYITPASKGHPKHF
jgi:hypothetical protein